MGLQKAPVYITISYSTGTAGPETVNLQTLEDDGMEENHELIPGGNNELLDIFTSEEDRHGDDLLQMSDFLGCFQGKLENRIHTDTVWDDAAYAEGLEGEIAGALQAGIHMTQTKTLVADWSHLPEGIKDGLESGLYRVGESKTVDGNKRASIVDKDGRIVKNITLKEAHDPTAVLSDISALSMQRSLSRMTEQIAEIGENVRDLMDYERRMHLTTSFVNARDRIMRASSASPEARDGFLEEADRYLMEGLNSLYADLDGQVKALADLKGPTAGFRRANRLVGFFCEDMQMIQEYVGVRIYLFNCRDMEQDAVRVLDDYRYKLQTLTERKLEHKKYTAAELIHQNYAYDRKDAAHRDFWLEKPRQMMEAVDSYKALLGAQDKPVYYIVDAEETENE